MLFLVSGMLHSVREIALRGLGKEQYWTGQNSKAYGLLETHIDIGGGWEHEQVLWSQSEDKAKAAETACPLFVAAFHYYG